MNNTMKRKLYGRFIAFVFVTCCVFPSLSAKEYIKTVKQHPYLYYTNERIEKTKERIKKDQQAQAAWEEMLKKSDEVVQSGKGGDMEMLSLVYRMTGDKKYGEQAKRILQDLLNREAWEQLDDRTPKWNSALGTAHNSGLSANVFDAIYDMLTPQERKQMADRIVVLGIKPSIDDWTSTDKRLHTLNSMGHNWWSSLVFKAGIASLAVMTEIPEAKLWAEDMLEAADEWFAFDGSVLENKPSNFDPNGGFYESLGYANFGVGEYLFFRLAWTNAVGAIQCRYDGLLQNTMNWFIQMSYPNSDQLMSMNFGDGSITSNGERPVKLMMALGFNSKNYDWYLAQTKKGKIREDLSVNTPLGLVYDPIVSKSVTTPDLPLSATYNNMGWASMRSSWNENATLFGIKSGYTWNHAHADAGSFILFHNGKNLLIDGGNVNYGNPYYSSYSVRSEAHNVVLFDGKAQFPEDQYHAVKTPGSLYHLMDAGNLKYILADATGPTSHYFLRNYRNVIWVGNVILIIDDLKTYEPGKFEWLLHTATNAQVKGIDMEVTDGDASVLVRPLFPETLPNGYPHDFPEKMRIEERTGVKDHDPKTMVTYYSIFNNETVRNTKFITAVILLDENNRPIDGAGWKGMSSSKEMRHGLPKIEKLQGTDMIGVRVTQNGQVTDVYLNLLADGRVMHRNSHNVIDGWETDAYMLSFTYKEGETSSKFNNFFVANGSYVRKPEHTVISSLSKVFMNYQTNNKRAEILLQGQPLIKLHLLPQNKESELVINGEKASYEKGRSGEMVIRYSEKPQQAALRP